MPDQPEARHRDAARTKDDLLRAAQELFTERGYARTTVRDIGERAGVDPTLIARYYGNKARLYIATLKSGEFQWDLFDAESLDRVVRLSRRIGTGPVLQSTVLRHEDDEVHAATVAALHDRLVTPVATHLLKDDEGGTAQLRAEVAVAAFAGVLMALSSEALPALSAASDEEVVAALSALLDGLRSD
jgi:AcrR family transcriptional regulator